MLEGKEPGGPPSLGLRHPAPEPGDLEPLRRAAVENDAHNFAPLVRPWPDEPDGVARLRVPVPGNFQWCALQGHAGVFQPPGSDEIIDASLQELCRCLQIIEPTFYVDECQAVWSDVPVHQARKPVNSREFGRFAQHVRRQLVRRYGTAVVDEAERIADRCGLREHFERNVFNALIFHPRRRALKLVPFVTAVGRAVAKYVLVRNQAAFYQLPGQEEQSACPERRFHPC